MPIGGTIVPLHKRGHRCFATLPESCTLRIARGFVNHKRHGPGGSSTGRLRWGKLQRTRQNRRRESLTPPPKRNRKACSFLDQHSNFSNFGKLTCDLAKCNFAHIDAWNYADGVLFIRIHQSHERIGREIRVSHAGTRGKPSHLSDQDLLAEVAKDSFTMAHHNIVAFDLWYNQSAFVKSEHRRSWRTT